MSAKLLMIGSTLSKGGIQGVISNLTLELQRKYEIDILLNNQDEILYPYGGHVISLDIKQPKNMGSLWYQLKIFLKRCIVLYKLKKTKEYFACISMMDSANVANIITKRKGCKTIGAVYTNISARDLGFNYKYVVGPLARLLYNKADKLAITSKGVMWDLETNYKIKREKMQVIYDGIDLEGIRKSAKEPLNEQEKELLGECTITALGRLDYPKGYRHLIRVMKRVRETYPKVRLLIMGAGNLYDELMELIRECGLEDTVILCGYTANPYKFIANSSLYVMSSVVEGFPTVLMEAITCGTPVVSTDMRSGAREILAPDSDFRKQNIAGIEYAEYGVLVPVCDGEKYSGNDPLTREEEILAQAISELLGDNERQERYRLAYQKYYPKFSRQACAEEWMKILSEL